MQGRSENEVSPSLADLDELVPPACATPVAPQNIVIFIFLEDTLSAEVEYVEKRMIVEDVDRFTERRAEFTHTLTKRAEERAYLWTVDARLLAGVFRGEDIDELYDLLSTRRLYSKFDRS
jgi:hypothetical protein